MNLNKRLEKIEAVNTPVKKIQIKRIIIDNKDQLINRDKYREVLIEETENRKIYELRK